MAGAAEKKELGFGGGSSQSGSCGGDDIERGRGLWSSSWSNIMLGKWWARGLWSMTVVVVAVAVAVAEEGGKFGCWRSSEEEVGEKLLLMKVG